ncbi:MAG: SDR family oxidoreductase [Caldilineaceae bacterium]|nr:SDR family oxidoreductase [Caldilineaceae bacterium]
MILIVGASGLLGREAAKTLLAQGEQVRAFTRTHANVDDLKKTGAEVMQGDLIDPPSLRRACQGVDRVLAAAHSIVGDGRYSSEAVDDAGHRALIDAAKAEGVSHFVYMSILGASANHPVDFWRTKYGIEEYLKASGLSYTILRPSAFMETHAHALNGKPLLESGKTTLLGKGTKPRNFVAVRDVAHYAVLALTDPKMKNLTLEIGGLGNFTNKQVAVMYARIANIPLKVSHVPTPMVKMLRLILQPFKPGVSRVMYMNSLPDDAFNEEFDPTSLLAQFPTRLTTLEAFIHERVDGG